MPGFLLLRLEAPLMSFGGPMVDQIGRTRSFPGQAQITGLLGNALGYRHQDAGALERLQTRLRMAAALVEPGELLRDYHTVDLGRPHLVGTGWTTRGVPEMRGGASSEGTHIRQRWYLADALVLVALLLEPAEESPGLDDLAAALDSPARPLFIGRKTCLPTAPLLLARTEAASATGALRHAMTVLPRRTGAVGPAFASAMPTKAAVTVEMDERLVAKADAECASTAERLVDRRDWKNQMHTGARAVRRLHLQSPAENGQGAGR